MSPKKITAKTKIVVKASSEFSSGLKSLSRSFNPRINSATTIFLFIKSMTLLDSFSHCVKRVHMGRYFLTTAASTSVRFTMIGFPISRSEGYRSCNLRPPCQETHGSRRQRHPAKSSIAGLPNAEHEAANRKSLFQIDLLFAFTDSSRLRLSIWVENLHCNPRVPQHQFFPIEDNTRHGATTKPEHPRLGLHPDTKACLRGSATKSHQNGQGAVKLIHAPLDGWCSPRVSACSISRGLARAGPLA
jgi:hypothetical protein